MPHAANLANNLRGCRLSVRQPKLPLIKIAQVDVPKCHGNSQPFRKVFFELSDDLGSCQRGTHGSGGDGDRDAAVDVSVGQLQMKLLVKEQQLQQVKIECKESSERITTLEAQAQELGKT